MRAGLETRGQIEQMENRRVTLNEMLMHTRTRQEANAIEREILLLCMEIAHYKTVIAPATEAQDCGASANNSHREGQAER
ncbi:MAG TPA: hypothetical protein VN661_08230 [Candidatus Acidoferrales bacterium]|nr:hypothetical protein [Candidatus Acidoferrales bacterium]